MGWSKCSVCFYPEYILLLANTGTLRAIYSKGRLIMGGKVLKEMGKPVKFPGCDFLPTWNHGSSLN